jgi:hypothetical protein
LNLDIVFFAPVEAAADYLLHSVNRCAYSRYNDQAFVTSVAGLTLKGGKFRVCPAADVFEEWPSTRM